jgi:integrase
MHVQFQPLLDFLVGTGARHGEAAGLLNRHLHLDAPRPFVEVRLVLNCAGKKWRLGRPKTRSSLRRVTLSPPSRGDPAAPDRRQGASLMKSASAMAGAKLGVAHRFFSRISAAPSGKSPSDTKSLDSDLLE